MVTAEALCGLQTPVRTSSREEVLITEEAAGLFPRARRLWEQVVEAVDGGREAEDFQAVSARRREAMVTCAGEVAESSRKSGSSTSSINWSSLSRSQ